MTPTAQRRAAPHKRGPAAGGRSPDAAPEPKVYVLKEGWLEVLAGDDPDLRTRPVPPAQRGEPLITVISRAAGLDRTLLSQINSNRWGLSLRVMGALVTFLEVRRGMSEEQARDALFARVPASAVGASRTGAVA